MKQASTELNTGVTIYRWYVYATDGHRYSVWETTKEAALLKAIRSKSEAISDRVDPAPAMSESTPNEVTGPLPASTIYP